MHSLDMCDVHANINAQTRPFAPKHSGKIQFDNVLDEFPLGKVNNALDDLYEELKKGDLEPITELVKDCIEAPKSEGGVGATPGKAHGGDLNGGDSLDVVVHQDKWLKLIPETWDRKLAWQRYFQCLKFVLPPLLRSRFWSDEEISMFEEMRATF